MIEELERVWIDRELNRYELTFFDQVVDLVQTAEELALDEPASASADWKTDARVVVENPSDRMIANAWYLPASTCLQTGVGGDRLVIGSVINPGKPVSLSARQVAAEYLCGGLIALYGEQDGRFSVVIDRLGSFSGGAIDMDFWLLRARQAAGLEMD